MTVSGVILLYIAEKIVDKLLEDSTHSLIDKLRALWDSRKYRSRLISIMELTIANYEARHKLLANDEGKLPFYHSKTLFEELVCVVLFEKEPDYDTLLRGFGENRKIVIPSKEELNYFFELFTDHIHDDKVLAKLFIDKNYKRKIFELEDTIRRIENTVGFNPSSGWFIKQNKAAIQDLGNRYSPVLSVELSDALIFDGLARTDKFKEMALQSLDNLLTKSDKMLQRQSTCSPMSAVMDELAICLNKLYEIYSSTEFGGTKPIPIDSLEKITSEIWRLAEELRKHNFAKQQAQQQEKADSKSSQERGLVREFLESLSDFSNLIGGPVFRLANDRILVIDGEAGIGKSHLLGDAVARRMSNGYESIFLLGRQLMGHEDVWSQILRILQVKSNKHDFLAKLNRRGKESGKRVIIFIDAINEGQGKILWPPFLRSFIGEIKEYEWLGLVLTVRSSYNELFFSEEDLDGIVWHTLRGFRNVEHEAAKLFFKHYEIELPTVPLLYHEFQNPLFLKLFCESISKSGLNRIPDGLQGITSIIDYYMDSINKTLAKPDSVNYSTSLKLVTLAVQTIIEYQIDNNVKQVPYAKAHKIVYNAVSPYIDKKDFVEDLISEGVLSKDVMHLDGQYEEIVYFTYERFDDHLTAQYLLETYPNLDEEFKQGGNLYRYVCSEKAIYKNRGLIDAFSIQVPEVSNKELFEYIPDQKDSYAVVESFFQSLIWRKLDSIDEKSVEYVNECVLANSGTYHLLWETVLSVAAVPKHFLNARFLHRNLKPRLMADRDARWTTLLRDLFYSEGVVERLINWAWDASDKSHISDESIELASITLAWFLTSPHRRLRDSSTKALVSILQDRIHVLIIVLKQFEGVNDPYVYERLFAVAYGCAVRTMHTTYLVELSEYIFETIFKGQDEVYPHALLRDYAREAIEYVYYQGLPLSFDINLVRPPYRSEQPSKVLSIEEIDRKYKFDYDTDKPKYYYSQNVIISSMTTQYGRGAAAYGDFGRYVFQRALKSWDVDIGNLSNLAIEWIFEKYGYNVEKHGKYDCSLHYVGRTASTSERIGKKYQWIALHEMVARVSDNSTKFDEWDFAREKEEPYQGPWSPYIRDIDPTMLINKTGYSEESDHDQYWWELSDFLDFDHSDQEWLKMSVDLPDLGKLIEVVDDHGEEWLVLESYPEWSEPKRIGEERWVHSHKRLWTHVSSYLVREVEFHCLKKWASQQNFMGRWMPEASSRYEIFSREYYWSPAHDYFMQESVGGPRWHDIVDRESNKYVAQVLVTTESFLWEEEFDKSKADVISFLKPCKEIYTGMKLEYSRREGEFLNCKGEVVCFATNVYCNSKPHLLVKKAPFLQYLAQNKLSVIWTVLGEKQIIGGFENSLSWLEMSGAYYLEDGVVTGERTTVYEER